ncbi:MAG: hypothetical protein B7X06_02140 [Verrucomicrobia bacterium 21-51-4]|nr:MAG: hypothetical protein B7X06_02140 [Verrucomicrobia bacterium 21-51-4]HQU08911.1 IspD/TarI family cytidylyltransferase [Opitutales bacterium]
MHTAILLAAGSSQRMGQSGLDKTVMAIAGKPVIAYSIAAFLKSGITQTFWVTYRDADQLSTLQAITAPFGNATFHWVHGGASRAESVTNALNTIPTSFEYVFIHDCARPLITAQALLHLKAAVETHGAASLAHKVKDTIKRIPSGHSMNTPLLLEDLDRSTLWAMETPQAFNRALIQQAYAKAPPTLTDDNAAVALVGHTVQLVENAYPNPKLTTAEDIGYIEYLLAQESASSSTHG